MITEAKRNAIKAVLGKVCEGLMKSDEALVIIEGIVDTQQNITYIPYYQPYYEDNKYWWRQWQTTCGMSIKSDGTIQDTKQPLDK